VTLVDLDDSVVLLPPGGRQRLLADAPAETHRRLVGLLDEPPVSEALTR